MAGEGETDLNKAIEQYHVNNECEWLLNYLNSREARCIDCRYKQGMTRKEIAAEFGVSISRINQIEKEAIRKMNHRAILETKFLRTLKRVKKNGR